MVFGRWTFSQESVSGSSETIWGKPPRKSFFWKLFFFKFVGSDTLVRKPHFVKFGGNKTFGSCFFGKCWKHCANRFLHAPGCVFFWFCIKKPFPEKITKMFVLLILSVCIFVCISCLYLTQNIKIQNYKHQKAYTKTPR